MKPINFLLLLIKENDTEVFIVLTAKDPQAPKRKVEFDFDSGTFIRVKMEDSMIDHMDIESICFHKYSAEARRQSQEGTQPIEWFNHLIKDCYLVVHI